MAQTMLAVVTIATILLMCHGVDAKRGCYSFGHSCFGGHGKRSMDNVQMMSNQRVGQEETPPHPVYSHPYNVLQPGDDIIPVRDGGAFDRDDSGVPEVMKLKFRNIFKHWMDSYRRSQQNDDSYYAENI